MFVRVKQTGAGTVIDFNGVAYKTPAEFETALAAAKRSRPNLTVVLRQDPGIDLQMVIDAMNVFEKLQVNVRSQ